MDQRDKIAILGFGEEGKAVLKYLTAHGYSDLTVCDQNVDIKGALPEGVSANLGKEYLENLNEFQVIFRSPGIPFLTPQIQVAAKSGGFVTSCTNYFLDQCPCPVIGVTGTKGKGTTATLLFQILKKSRLKPGQAEKKVFLGGNIGLPAMSFLDELKGNDLVVLELSSFQLQDLRKSPHYAILLNTTTDHLDYHVDRGEYMAAKENLLAHQGKKSVAVLNKDYEYVKYYEPLVKGKMMEVSCRGKVKDGAYVKNGKIFCGDEEVMEVKDVKLIGAHNLENVLPAVVIAKELGASNEDIVHVVKTFPGLAHRLELVREVRGVKYFNDSFATTPETSMAAVDSFDVPTILIAGGSEKGLDYNEWAVKILTKESLRIVILIGATAEKMERALVAAEEKLGPSKAGAGSAMGSPTKVLRRKDLDEALIDAYAEAEEGWVVVMSPAAASFGLFKNYKERGDTFKDLVRKLR